MPIKCKLCDKEFKNKIQYRHLKGEHNMTIKEYELIYGKGSTDLNYVEAEIPDKDKVECKECGEIFKNLITNTHLRIHGMTVDDYRQKYGDDSLYSFSYVKSCSDRLKGENNPNYGNTWSEEQKRSVSEKLKGREAWNKGVPQSEEQRQKQSKIMKQKYESGELVNARKGVSHTEEVKQLLSIKQKEYAENNKVKMSERGRKSYKTMKEKYGDEYVFERMNTIRSCQTEESKRRSASALRKAQLDKKLNARHNLNEKLSSNGYQILRIDDTYLTYRCPNHKQHTNRINYFRDYSWTPDEGCRMCMPKNVSIGEVELREFIYSLDQNTEINCRNLIHPYEIDIFSSEKRIGIEYNGLYWHSEQRGKDEYYHYDKYSRAKEQDIKLIQIFEDEWYSKKDIIKSIIMSKFNNSPNRIYARQCDVALISNEDSNQFIKKNHLYGNHKQFKNDLSYGLYFHGELIMVMTVVHNELFQYEIKRLCSKLRYSVAGGFTKMLSSFIKDNSPQSIMSYADLRFGDGTVYKQAGFEMLEKTRPAAWYFQNTGNLNNLKRRSWRSIMRNYSGKNIKKQAFDDGYYTIYDCGHNKWLWRNNE